MITLSDKGIFLDSEKKQTILPTQARNIADVCGAGDTVIASLSMALVAGQSFEQAAGFANLAAGVVVGKVGTANVSPEEIIALSS